MVHTASAVAFAVVAFNVASAMANPIYDNSNELVEREFTDVDVEARDFYDELDARAGLPAGLPASVYRISTINSAGNSQPAVVPVAQHGTLDDKVYFAVHPAAPKGTAAAAPSNRRRPRNYDEFEFEARDLFQQLSELDARDYDEIDAREYEEVYNYLRAVSSSSVTATSTASPALKTITKTSTFVPKPTSCTQTELKTKKQAKKLADKKAKQAKKVKAAARRAKKLLEKKAKKNAKKQAKNAKKGKHSSATTSSSTSVSVTPTSVTSSGSIRPTSTVTGAHRVAAAHITAAPNAKAAVHANLSSATVTGKHGTVTVRVTTTAAQPACTRAGKFKKLFKHKQARNLEEADNLFSREYDFDELD